MFKASPFVGGDSRRTRDILVLLRGDLGKGRPATFSQGVRQRLASLAAAGNWRRRYNAWIGTPQELPGDQSTLLSRSRYCLVVPLDGWSGGFEDAVLHGCIPVVVVMGQGLAQPFSALLRLSSGMVKVHEQDLSDLPNILERVPVAQEATMRAELAALWSRMAWLTHPWVKKQAAETMEANLRKYPWVGLDLQRQWQQQADALKSMGQQPPVAVLRGKALGGGDHHDGVIPPAAEAPEAGSVDDGLLVPEFPAGSMEVSAGQTQSGVQQGEVYSGNVGQVTSDDKGSDASTSRHHLDNTQLNKDQPSTSSSSGSALPSWEGASSTADSSGVVTAVDGSGESSLLPATVTASEADAVAELFAVRVWQPDAPLDDAFTTLMQVSACMCVDRVWWCWTDRPRCYLCPCMWLF